MSTKGVARIALGILAVGILLAEVVMFQTARSMADRYPEFAHLEGPLVAAAIAFGVCVQAVLLITALLVGLINRGRIFDKVALRPFSPPSPGHQLWDWPFWEGC